MWHSWPERTSNRPPTVGRPAVLVVLVALASAGCGIRTEPHAGAASAPTPSAAGHRACEAPTAMAHPVPALPPGARWFGHDGLWIDVAWTRDPRAVSAGGQAPGVVAGVKYATVTMHGGRFTEAGGPPTITARELGSGRTVRGETGGYAFTDSLRWWPTGIAFPTLGCWQVRTTWAGSSVRFRVPIR